MTGRPNVARAGAWTATGWPATMEGAIRSGAAAAAQLEASLREKVVA
jgi:monoamine oxidase